MFKEYQKVKDVDTLSHIFRWESQGPNQGHQNPRLVFVGTTQSTGKSRIIRTNNFWGQCGQLLEKKLRSEINFSKSPLNV